MMDAHTIEEFERDALELRLNEQVIFKGALETKHRKFKRILLVSLLMFVTAALMWLTIHCLPMSKNI
jgi:hypothetical protein